MEFKPRTKLNAQHSLKRNRGGEVAKEKKENNETVTIKQLYPPSSNIYPLSFPEKKIMHLI